MKLRSTFLLASLTVGGSTLATTACASMDIARWSFGTITSAPFNNPPATTMLTTALALPLGMDNAYNGGNTASCDVTPTGANPDPFGTQNAWRVRGTPANGWALAAPEYTQGAEFDVSTVGYRNITFSFDWFCTNQGIRDLQVQYNLDVRNQNGWTNFKGHFAGNPSTETDGSGDVMLIARPNGYNTVGASVTTNSINFLSNGIRGVENNPYFGVRIVSAFDPATGTYSGASGGIYNNSSGNWRFDQIAVSAALSMPTSHAAGGG